MRPALLEGLRNIVLAFYRWLLKLAINAHQVFSHWRIRIQRDQRLAQRASKSQTNVGLTNELGRIATTIEFEDITHRESLDNHTSILSVRQTIGSNSVKTPNTRRLKLTSLFRRLSFRNFMEYCVIALNEASNSGCSNRFDLSSCNSPVWLIGRRYELPGECEKLIDDIRSKIWITYRKNFPPIDENTRYTTDRGFGCMIRCGQMVLANALLCKSLGRDWRWSPKGLDANPEVYRKILKLFQDREDCLYSIHRIVRTSQHEGKYIGEWFGPNTIAQALKRLSSTYFAADHIDNEILISIDAALDNVVVVDEIKSKFKHKLGTSSKNGSGVVSGCDGDNRSRERHQVWIPGILFIQLRLGLTKINPLYFAALKKTFQFKNSLGIIGGRPNHALYLVGYTDEDIIYLDPHSTQQYIDFDRGTLKDGADEQQCPDMMTEQSATTFQPLDITYHCSCPEKMPLERLDPSLALCFYFNTEDEFDNWCNSSQDLLIKSEQAPMFEITKSRPSDWNIPLTSRTVTSSSGKCVGQSFEQPESANSKQVENQSNSSDHDEEFEMLA